MTSAHRAFTIGVTTLWAVLLIVVLAAPGARSSATSLTSAPRAAMAAMHNVRAIALAARSGGGRTVAYAVTSAGLYRAQTPFFSWEMRDGNAHLVAIAPRPDDADDLVLSDGHNIYHSSDGGLSLSVTGPDLLVSTFARSAQEPGIIFGGGHDNSYIYIYRSTDDGVRWSTVYSATDEGYSPPSVNDIAMSNSSPGQVVAGATFYHGGAIFASSDGGNTWHALPQPSGLVLMAPQTLAVNPARSVEMWASWSVMGYGALMHSVNGGQTWTAVSAGLPADAMVLAMTYDLLTQRLYVIAASTMGAGRNAGTAGPSAVYAWQDGGPFERFAPRSNGVNAILAVDARDGLLLANAANNLIVIPLIAPLNWAILPALATYYAAHDGVRLLGRPIGPSTHCGASVTCQYFEKGCLESPRAPAAPFTYAALVPPLLATKASLPIGGVTSTLTYATLATLTGPRYRVAPPTGFHAGTASVPGGTFIPDSPTLARAAGYIVPSYFWQEMTRPSRTPGGWLHDVGLPLTPAVQATVTKGSLGARAIMVQAFTNAILTYDSRNTPQWQVEHANSGADYAHLFASAVR